MITEKDTIKCEAIFDEERGHRYLWRRVWNKEKPIVAVVMLNPCLSDSIIMDTTTSLVVNNVARLEEYGGVEILNLYSKLTSKLNFRFNSDEDLNREENDKFIVKSAEICTKVILAWGKAPNTNHRVAQRTNAVIKLLEPYKDKLYVISDGERNNLHPLTPSIRSQWILEKFDMDLDEANL